MSRSKIEWTERTWNVTVGCTRVSEGCRHCFAERMAKRLQAMGRPEYQDTVNGNGRWTGVVNLVSERLEEPLRRKKPTTYFVDSMSDLFHEDIPPSYIYKVFAVMAEAYWHTFQVLTKRPYMMNGWVNGWLRSRKRTEPLDNVWLGVSAESQQAADERVPLLLRTPATVRFVSAEPLLGPVILDPRWLPDPHGPAYNIQVAWDEDTHTLDWVIAGGESGPYARPCHPDWMRRLRDQCQETGVAFFMKQWGEWIPVGQEPPGTFIERDRGFLASVKRGHRIEYLDSAGKFRDTNELENFKLPSDWIRVARVGKKAAGRLLDGREHSEMPKGA